MPHLYKFVLSDGPVVSMCGMEPKSFHCSWYEPRATMSSAGHSINPVTCLPGRFFQMVSRSLNDNHSCCVQLKAVNWRQFLYQSSFFPMDWFSSSIHHFFKMQNQSYFNILLCQVWFLFPYDRFSSKETTSRLHRVVALCRFAAVPAVGLLCCFSRLICLKVIIGIVHASRIWMPQVSPSKAELNQNWSSFRFRIESFLSGCPRFDIDC